MYPTIVLLSLFVLMNINNLFAEQYNLSIPTRITEGDKRYLAADLHSIDTTIAKPVILIQTPYNKNIFRLAFLSSEFASQVQLPIDLENFNYVIVDWRGFYGSKEAAIAQYDRGLDGYDIIEWIAEQTWSNGKIGTWGASALGNIQFQTARHKPPHLICALPLVSNYKNQYSNYYYGGVLRLEHVECLVKLGFFPSIKTITDHPSYDLLWQTVERMNDYPNEISIPVLMISGWYDHFPTSIINAFRDLINKSDINVRSEHKLVMGPWLHSSTGRLEQGILNYPNAVDLPMIQAREFFGYYLLGEKNAWVLKPPIQYYIMGSNRWESSYDWENEGAELTYYIHPGKILRDEYPPETLVAVPPDTIIYDPRNPTPSFGGERFNPFDQSIVEGPQDISKSIELRNDILVYSTETLVQPITVKGRVKSKFYLASDRKDTDIGIRLTEVDPNGNSIIIRQGIKRLRFRNSFAKEELMQQGDIYSVEVELDDIAHTFMPGNKIRMVVSSANYPHYDLNPNNGDKLYQSGDTLIAENLIYSDSQFPSQLVLPLYEPTSISLTDESLSQVLIFPNPAKNSINIRLPSDYNELKTVKVFNILGQVIKRLDGLYRQNSFSIEFDRSDSGLYFLHLESKDKVEVRLFIISK